MYYAKARFYSADDKRFVAMDPIKGSITDPLSLVSYLYCVNNPLRYVDPLGLFFIYKHVDENGNEYFSIEAQKEWDAIVSNLISALGENWQSVIYEFNSGGKLFDGTSVLDTKRTLYDDVSTSGEFAQFEAAIEQYIAAAHPLGQTAVVIYETGKLPFTFAIKLFVDVPSAMKVPKRDDILLEVMRDAGINTTRNYVPHFVSAAFAADEFIQQEEINWMFAEQQIFDGFTPYQVGKAAFNNNTSSTAYTNAYHQLYASIYASLYSSIGEAIGVRTYDSYTGRWTYVLVPGEATNYFLELAKAAAEEEAKKILSQMGENYKIIIDCFQKLFCPGSSGGSSSGGMESYDGPNANQTLLS